jgi:hypothetical protein
MGAIFNFNLLRKPFRYGRHKASLFIYIVRTLKFMLRLFKVFFFLEEGGKSRHLPNCHRGYQAQKF